MRNSIKLMMIGLVFVACNKDETDPPAELTQSIPSEFRAFEGLFDGEGVGAAMNLKDDILILFDASGDRYAWIEDQEVKIVNDIDAEDSPFNSCLFDAIGAAAKTHAGRLYVYDEDGARYTNADFDIDEVEGRWNDPEVFDFWQSWSNTNLWGPDNTIEINSVSAMWTVSEVGGDCFDSAETYEQMYLFDGNGDEYVIWNMLDFDWDSSVMEIEDFTAENNCDGLDGLIPFESIGAACRYVEANRIRDIIFNEEGTRFCFYTVSEGVFSEVYDLY